MFKNFDNARRLLKICRMPSLFSNFLDAFLSFSVSLIFLFLSFSFSCLFFLDRFPVSLPFLLSFSHSCSCCYCSFSFIFLFLSFSFVLMLLLHLSVFLLFFFFFFLLFPSFHLPLALFCVSLLSLSLSCFVCFMRPSPALFGVNIAVPATDRWHRYRLSVVAIRPPCRPLVVWPPQSGRSQAIPATIWPLVRRSGSVCLLSLCGICITGAVAVAVAVSVQRVSVWLCRLSTARFVWPFA